MKTALRLLEKTADPCPPLKAVVGGLVGCLDLSEVFCFNFDDCDMFLIHIQAVVGNREDYKQLADDLKMITTVLQPYVGNLVQRDAHGSIALIIRYAE